MIVKKIKEPCIHLFHLFRIFVKDYQFLRFTKNIGKNVSGKYIQNLFDSAPLATKAADDLIGNKMADTVAKLYNDDKITRFTSKNALSKSITPMQTENKTRKEIYKPPRKSDKLLMNLD